MAVLVEVLKRDQVIIVAKLYSLSLDTFNSVSLILWILQLVKN